MERIRVDGNYENNKEVMTALGHAWKSLDQADKSIYQLKAEKAKSASALPADFEAVPQGTEFISLY
jgi:hypothetical protein